MKIADYGKAITSYIESPTTAQKLKSKESANLLAEVDFSGMTAPQLRILYERYTGVGAPKDPRELIIELKRLMKNLDQDGVPLATGGRVHLAEGSEDIVEPPKSMQVDTTTKGPNLFTINNFKDKAEIYVGALYNGALPAAEIKSALNKFTRKGIDDGTFTADDAIKVVQDLKFQFQDRAQKQRLRGVVPEGIGTVKREDLAGGTKLMDEYLGAQKEYQKAVDDGFQGTYEEFLRYKYSGSFADGGRAKLAVGAIPFIPTAITAARPLVSPLVRKGAEFIGGTALGKRLSDTFFNETFAPDADEIEKTREEIRESLKPGETKPIDTGPIKTGETTPPKIDLTEKFPIGETMKPIAEGFPAETEQLPIIFQNKNVKEVKKTFDEVDKEYVDRDTGYAKRIDNLYSEDFAKKVKQLVDNNYGGNVARLANDLNIERVRINTLFSKHGLKAESEGRTTVQNIFVDKDKDKLSIPELTNNIKGNETYLINRAKERFVNYSKEKNTFKNFKDIAEIVGVDLPDKTAQDFFQTKLRNANKKVGIETKSGLGREVLYNLGDAVNALTKTNLAKPVEGTGRVHDKLRSKFETDKDRAGYNTRTEVLRIIRDAQNNVFNEGAILKAGEQYGHAEAIANQQKYKKLFKNSNAADISTLVFQDPILNQDVLQAYGSVKTGIEQKRQTFLKKLESLVGKKATAENIQIANEALNGLNKLNDLARIQIKRFQKTNRFVRDQENRIPDFELVLPKEGGTFKSGFLKIDMSNIDPSVSVGRILEINPDAKTFNDLNKQEKEIYKENLKSQMVDYLSFFYKESGADKDDIEDFADTILEAKIGTRVKKAEGGSVYGKYAEQIARLP
jgi:hypothetical protein